MAKKKAATAVAPDAATETQSVHKFKRGRISEVELTQMKSELAAGKNYEQLETEFNRPKTTIQAALSGTPKQKKAAAPAVSGTGTGTGTGTGLEAGLRQMVREEVRNQLKLIFSNL